MQSIFCLRTVHVRGKSQFHQKTWTLNLEENILLEKISKLRFGNLESIVGLQNFFLCFTTLNLQTNNCLELEKRFCFFYFVFFVFFFSYNRSFCVWRKFEFSGNWLISGWNRLSTLIKISPKRAHQRNKAMTSEMVEKLFGLKQNRNRLMSVVETTRKFSLKLSHEMWPKCRDRVSGSCEYHWHMNGCGHV